MSCPRVLSARATISLPLLAVLLVAFGAPHAAEAQQRRRTRPQAGAGQFFVSPIPVEEMRGKQAVLTTDKGEIVLELLPDAAPNHVGHFMTRAREGAYDGTTFHRLVKFGIIQGGDPLSKDAAKKSQYGTGGLGVLRAEINDQKHTRGAVSAVRLPSGRDTAGSQFFICVVDQPALDGEYTVFARVVEGMSVVEAISAEPTDAEGRALERIKISRVVIRDTPPPEPLAFAHTPPAELARYRAVIETSHGPITIGFLPEKAPQHVRAFLRLAQAGVYDGTTIHRVVPGFVIQGGSLNDRATPLTERQQRLVEPLAPEFNDTAHVKGIVSMARGDDPASATTSFFICTGPAPSLDGKYTAFGQVVDGLGVVEAIERVERQGEAPVTRIEIARVRVEPSAP